MASQEEQGCAVADVLPLRTVETAPAGQANAAVPDHGRLIDRSELAHRLAVGVSTLDRLRAAGRIGPRAIKCGGVRFHLAEVICWISTPGPDGRLHGAEAWPAVWDALGRRPVK